MSTGAVLKPTTIIPSDLYVERAADRQLDQIVSDMGRPGYVLVARQMGKTNLLINMKRKRESSGDVVLYQDLSNRFKTSRALFRAIIDALIEGYFDDGSSAVALIRKQRETGGIEPNSEYDRHLRLLLREKSNTRFIIVFDEIDSLVSASYSDAIFAQIRSMYFSRVNYGEYERLTYVLSGVAEPTDLIKDKNISPFNIGEKIYLEDFSRAEYYLLLSKAKLALPSGIADEIYAWTSGNPRMTWDVTAGVEAALLSGEKLDVELVGSVVQKLYLTRFDLAPVDHIRVLVESDPLIRSAVISMRWNKGETLDERVKGRLYLAGITNAATSAPPKIKNKIIDSALSDGWIAEISAATKTLLETASEKFRAGSFEEVVRLSEEFARGKGGEAELPYLNRVQLGISRYNLGDYERAASDLGVALTGAPDDEAAPSVRFYLASAWLKAGRPSEALPLFQEAANHREHQQNAKLALASTYVALGAKENHEQIRQLGDEIIQFYKDVLADRQLTDEELTTLVSAYFNNAQASIAAGNVDGAVGYLDAGLNVSSSALKPKLLLLKADLAEAGGEREALLSGCVDLIIGRRIVFGDLRDTLTFGETILSSVLAKAIELGLREIFDKLILYARDTLYHQVHSAGELIVKLAKASIKADDTGTGSALLWAVFDYYAFADFDVKKRLEFVQLLAQYPGKIRKSEALSLYIDHYSERSELIGISDDDFVILANGAYTKINDSDYTAALEILDLASKAEVSREPYYIVIILSQKLNIYSTLGDIVAAKEVAREILEVTRTDVFSGAESDLVASINYMRQSATAVLRQREPDPFRGFGRNSHITVVDIETGAVISTKFKKVASELRGGRYRLAQKDEIKVR